MRLANHPFQQAKNLMKAPAKGERERKYE